jgi:hypothetical protein
MVNTTVVTMLTMSKSTSDLLSLKTFIVVVV